MTPLPPMLREERGNVLIVAMLVMMLLLSLGLAVLTQVDGQQRESARQRTRDSAFTVAEGALNAQIFQLSAKWPDGAAGSASCTQTSTAADCPSPAALTSTFGNVDQAKGTAWTTQVRDNGGSQTDFWSDALLGQPAYDANGDSFVWVRSTAVANGKRRTLVALVKAEQTTLNFPHHTLVAGWFRTTNNGAKVIVDNDGDQNQFTTSEMIVRCPLVAGTTAAAGCADFQAASGQVSPERVFSDPTQPTGVAPEALDSLRAAAKADGNYFASGCPASLQGDKPGEMVFIEQGSCTYASNEEFNTTEKPGAVIIANGSLSLNGDVVFHGIIYHANLGGANSAIVNLGGNAAVYGAVVADGAGGVTLGSSKLNLSWDPNVFTSMNGFGTASIVQNTFREITASS